MAINSTSSSTKEFLGNKSPDGTVVGQSTSDLVAFHGSTPVDQRSGADQAAVATTGATNSGPYGYTEAQANAIIALVNEIRAALVEKGLIAGA
jgi:hypothetical protein